MLNLIHPRRFIILMCLLASCSSGNKQTPIPNLEPVQSSDQPLSNEARVKNIKINTFESFPVRVDVVIQGELTDNCTTLDQYLPERKGNSFTVKITTNHQVGKYCEKQLQSFDLVLPLEVEGLKAGSYTVSVNGVEDTFELSVDNILKSRRN